MKFIVEEDRQRSTLAQDFVHPFGRRDGLGNPTVSGRTATDADAHDRGVAFKINSRGFQALSPLLSCTLVCAAPDFTASNPQGADNATEACA